QSHSRTLTGPMPGLFVTFEGGEGSGKSTQVTRLVERLAEAGLDPLVTREPGGTRLAEAIRTLLLDPGQAPGPVTEALLMEAAPRQRADRTARPRVRGVSHPRARALPGAGPRRARPLRGARRLATSRYAGRGRVVRGLGPAPGDPLALKPAPRARFRRNPRG